jgi:hypothetical protein
MEANHTPTSFAAIASTEAAHALTFHNLLEADQYHHGYT